MHMMIKCLCRNVLTDSSELYLLHRKRGTLLGVRLLCRGSPTLHHTTVCPQHTLCCPWRPTGGILYPYNPRLILDTLGSTQEIILIFNLIQIKILDIHAGADPEFGRGGGQDMYRSELHI